MLHIAICDNEHRQLMQTKALLLEYRGLHPELDFRIELFPSAAALLEHLRIYGNFDLYLLDILMPGTDGIELGVKIRGMDQGGHIVYLSTSSDYAVDSYRAKASGYLVKPIQANRLFPLLDDIIRGWLQENQAFITIKTRNGLQRLSIRLVVFGELVGRCIHYHLADGSMLESMSVRTSFGETVSDFLAHERFVLCGASFFVNLAFIDRVDATSLHLAAGDVLPLSRHFRADVTNRWIDYHLKGGEKL